MNKTQKKTLYVEGMHCPSCDILVKDKFGECANVQSVTADYRSQKVEIEYSGDLDTKMLNRKIASYGYGIAEKGIAPKEPLQKRIFDAGAIAVILFIAYYFSRELNILPENLTELSPTSYWAVFLLGLIASTSTCMATSGALFMATVKNVQKNERSEFIHTILPAISFNVGRVLSYGLFGYVVGMLGKSIATNLHFGAGLSLFVAVFMLFIGLDMAGVLPFSSLSIFSFTKKIFEPLQKRFIKNPKQTSFLLGAITYLLPCGFTQTVQFYALGLANPVQSALTMMIFALGTVPALLAIGMASSFTKSKIYPMIAKTMGVIIVMIGLGYVSNTLYLYGINTNVLGWSGSTAIDKNIVIQDGVQLAYMSVNSRGYSPTSFTVRKGIPVKWVIEGQNVFGCQGSLVAPKIAVSRTLEKGKNVIEFTPKETGKIAFSCAMGMFQGEFNVVEG